VTLEGKLTQKKPGPRDLSDLKARLGLAKPEAAAPQPAAPQPAAPVAQQPYAQPAQPAAPPGVVPPPGIAPPPGYPTAQPAAQPPPPDVRRDPFAQAAPVRHAAAAPIVDAGPPIEIPKEKKRPTKLIIAFIIVALVPLMVGYACGRIYASRVLFNKGIEDAGKIKNQVEQLAKINKRVAEVLHESRVRNQNKIRYDGKLIEDLKEILRASPDANAEKAKKRQDELFRTNYAMMESIVIDRLFNYYNNTIRLMAELEDFLRKAEDAKELLEKYADEISKEERKYGVVFAEDAGKYYLAQMVEVGDIVCTDPKAKSCAKEDINGFMVRTGMGGAWAPRPGKPGGKAGRITEIVIPIIPDEFFRQVVVGRPGYLAFKDFVNQYGRMAAIAGVLGRDERELMKDLGKAAGRDRLFVF
jgi:hypothetical protein